MQSLHSNNAALDGTAQDNAGHALVCVLHIGTSQLSESSGSCVSWKVLNVQHSH